MATITQIEIDGFKAFPENFVLDLEGGKNLLLYGENGSGKSSIYYALHAVFQSVLKDDRGAKYFKYEDEQHLININKINDAENNAYQPHISITFSNGDIWRLDRGGLTSENGGTDDTIKLLNRGSAFINHSYISRFHAARNSEDINLWNVFHKDILPFYRAKENEEFLSVQFDNIQDEANALPRLSNQSFLSRIADFNNKLSYFIEDTNKRIGNIYNDNFKFEGDPNLEIKLIYKSDDAPDNPSHDTYYLFYGNNRNGVKCPKSLVSPRIGIEIKENGKEIHKPQTYFNEARLTAIALAVRFASLSKKSDGCFLALDDMLISLDMSNRRKVIDYLFGVASNYNIYLFTHDRVFFEFFKHKSKRHKSSKEWIYKEIYMDDTRCPYIRDSRNYLGEAEHYIKQRKYEIAGIFLRKEAEAFCKRFLPPKWQLTKEYTRLNLNGMIQNCKIYASESGITDLSLFDELDDYRKFILNSSSHDSYDVVKFENEVRKCLRTLTILSNAKSETILKFGDNVTFTLKTPAPDIHEFRFDIQICDELRVIEIPEQTKVLSKVMINYYCYKDGIKGIKQNSNQTLKNFYDVNYTKSDGSESPDYLTGIKIAFNGLPIFSLL